MMKEQKKGNNIIITFCVLIFSMFRIFWVFFEGAIGMDACLQNRLLQSWGLVRGFKMSGGRIED